MPQRRSFFEQILPFPLRTVRTSWGTVGVYEIPEDQKKAVLEKLYPFHPIPSLGRLMEDIHSGKTFRVREFMVTREGSGNFLVSPYYFESGGTVIDWVPANPRKKQ